MIELYVSFFVLGYKYFAKLAHFPQTTKFLLQIINSMIQKFLLLYIIYCNFAPVICLFRLNIVSSFGMNRGLTRVTPLFRLWHLQDVCVLFASICMAIQTADNYHG